MGALHPDSQHAQAQPRLLTLTIGEMRSESVSVRPTGSVHRSPIDGGLRVPYGAAGPRFGLGGRWAPRGAPQSGRTTGHSSAHPENVSERHHGLSPPGGCPLSGVVWKMECCSCCTTPEGHFEPADKPTSAQKLLHRHTTRTAHPPAPWAPGVSIAVLIGAACFA